MAGRARRRLRPGGHEEGIRKTECVRKEEKRGNEDQNLPDGERLYSYEDHIDSVMAAAGMPSARRATGGQGWGLSVIVAHLCSARV